MLVWGRLKRNKNSGLRPDKDKVRAVTQIPLPQNKQELLRFIVMIWYLSKFIPNLSDISAPLRKLHESDTEWHWEETHKKGHLKQTVMLQKASTLKMSTNQSHGQ